MSPASLAVARVVPASPARHPDQVRIAALSVAIALNLAVLLAALRPLPAPLSVPRAAPALPLHWIVPEPTPPVPPPAVPRPLPPKPHPVAAPRPLPAPPVAAPVRLSDEGSQAAPPVTEPTLAPPGAAVVAPAPVETSLAYRAAPLRYPPVAVRQRLEGTVLLRVLVDEQGRPVEVQVEQSSGHALLDRSAREQVLAGWRFEPAMAQGHAVRAWARVPVTFLLRQL